MVAGSRGKGRRGSRRQRYVFLYYFFVLFLLNVYLHLDYMYGTENHVNDERPPTPTLGYHVTSSAMTRQQLMVQGWQGHTMRNIKTAYEMLATSSNSM